MFEVEMKVPADLGPVRRRLQEVDAELLQRRRQRDIYYNAPDRDFAKTDEALRLRYQTATREEATSGDETDSGDEYGVGSEAVADTVAEAGNEGLHEADDAAGRDPSVGDAVSVRDDRRGRDGSEVTDDSGSNSTPSGPTITYKGPLVDTESKTREEHQIRVSDGERAEAILAGLRFTQAATVIKEREFWTVQGTTVTLDRVEGVGEFVEVERQTDESSRIEGERRRLGEVLELLGLDTDQRIRTSYLELLLADE